jgi:putative transposase
MVSPAQRRELVDFFVESMELSERLSCELAGLSRSVRRYQSQREPDVGLRTELRKLAGERPRFGYRRLGCPLRRRGVVVNHKRLWRIYRDEGLVVRRKKRKRVAAAPRETRPELTGPNQRWSMDFMSDSLKDGRTLRVSNVVDDWSRFCPAMEVDLSLSAHRVVRALEQAGELYGLPKSIVMDNGPEFTSRVLDQWAHERGIELIFIRPGKPTENAYAESFNGRVREECLNQHWFDSVEHARDLCLAWRDDYNFIRPHTSLGGLSPSEFLLQSPGGHARPGSAALLDDRGHSTDGSESPYHLQQARV